MEKISSAIDVPLVLHGGSGIPEDQIKKAIALGHGKINVNTECQQQFTKAVRDFLNNNDTAFDPRKFLTPGRDAIKATVIAKMAEFGSAGKA